MGNKRRGKPLGKARLDNSREPSQRQVEEGTDSARFASIPAALDDLCAIGKREISLGDVMGVLIGPVVSACEEGNEPTAVGERLRRILTPHAECLVPGLQHVVGTNGGPLIIDMTARYLAYCGRSGAKALLDLLDHPKPKPRRAASFGVARFGPNEAWALRHLVKYLAFRDWEPGFVNLQKGVRNIAATVFDAADSDLLISRIREHRRRELKTRDEHEFFRDLGLELS